MKNLMDYQALIATKEINKPMHHVRPGVNPFHAIREIRRLEDLGYISCSRISAKEMFPAIYQQLKVNYT
jgi:hypothetical protein